MRTQTVAPMQSGSREKGGIAAWASVTLCENEITMSARAMVLAVFFGLFVCFFDSLLRD